MRRLAASFELELEVVVAMRELAGSGRVRDCATDRQTDRGRTGVKADRQ